MRAHTITIAALLSCCSTAAIAQEYQIHVIEALSEFGIPEAYLSGVNDSGTAVGTMTYTTQDSNGNYHTTYHGYVWTPDGGPVVNQDPSGYSDINERGDILAGSTILFADGRTRFMSAVPGDRSVGGAAINDAGVVAGTSTYRFYSGCRYERRAVMWSEATNTVNLEAFVPSADVGRDINNADELVGVASFTGSCGDFEAFLYRAGTDEWVDLHSMLVGDGPGITEARAINNLGQVAGEGWNGSFGSAWLWDETEGFTFLPALKNGDRDRVIPYGLNSAGSMVGSAATDGWADTRAFIWDQTNGMRDLNDLVDLPQDFILDRAVEISESGIIIGDGHWGPGFGAGVAFVLMPLADACPADFNDDGDLNTLDVLAFLNAWNANEGRADFNQDGDINTLDVLAFLNAWNTGC